MPHIAGVWTDLAPEDFACFNVFDDVESTIVHVYHYLVVTIKISLNYLHDYYYDMIKRLQLKVNIVQYVKQVFVYFYM
jgi:hypothetical protein